MGDNIGGPSLIRVPAWVENPLGRYYLYFGHHDGDYIRLAYSDKLEGPWCMHEPGVLSAAEGFFAGHVASPDVHVDDERRQIRLYYHGADERSAAFGPQSTRVALSSDGLNFEARNEDLGPAYFRVFHKPDGYYAIAMPGHFLRSSDGLSGFTPGPTLFAENMRHAAVMVDGPRLSVFYSNAGDCPERILLSVIDVSGDWHSWTESEAIDVLAPELDYEGGDLPREPSVRGQASEPVCQLRDPGIFREDGTDYLLYSVAGERGIAMAEIRLGARHE